MKVDEQRKLIIGLKKGEKDSYRTLFTKFYAVYVRFVNLIIKDHAAAEDIVQDVFVKVYLNRSSLNENASLENYLFVLSKNAALNFIRSKKKNAVLNLEVGLLSDARSESQALSHEIEQLMRSTVSKMPLKRQTVFRLSREKDLTNKEIAQKLGISEKTVERHITMALSQLRNNIKS